MSGETAPSSFLHRLATTPLRDVLRGRLTGRLDMDRVFTGVGLPPTLEALVRSVCKRARLWRSERVEVARELASHFGDGLAAGRTAAELERDFGSVREAAKLIRRAAIRKRPLMWHIRRRTQQAIGVLIVLVVLMYAVFFAWLYLGSPSVKRNYFAEYNAKVEAIPEAERAYPLLRRGMLALPKMPAHVRDFIPGLYAGDADWQETLAYVEAAQPAIAFFREAAGRQHLGMAFTIDDDAEVRDHLARVYGKEPRAFERDSQAVVERNPPLYTALMPWLGWQRNAARHLKLDLHVAVAQGDAKRASEDLQAMLGWAELSVRHDTVIGQLVGIATFALACNAVQEVLALDPGLLSDEQLVGFAHRLGAVSGGRFRIDPRFEREQFVDILQRSFTDDGRGDGHITYEGLRFLRRTDSVEGHRFSRVADDPLSLIAASPLLTMLAGRKDMLAEFDRHLEYVGPLVQTPPWQRTLSMFSRVEERERRIGWLVRYWPVQMHAVVLDKAVQSADQANATREATQALIALHVFKRREGRWPSSLSELVPGLLARVPVDVMDGRALRYRAEGEAMTLYSIGVDRRDDGGTPNAQGDFVGMLRAVDAKPDPAFTGDWVFWPYEVVRPERK